MGITKGSVIELPNKYTDTPPCCLFTVTRIHTHTHTHTPTRPHTPPPTQHTHTLTTHTYTPKPTHTHPHTHPTHPHNPPHTHTHTPPNLIFSYTPVAVFTKMTSKQSKRLRIGTKLSFRLSSLHYFIVGKESSLVMELYYFVNLFQMLISKFRVKFNKTKQNKTKQTKNKQPNKTTKHPNKQTNKQTNKKQT